MPYLNGKKISDLEYIHAKYGHRSKRLLNEKLQQLELKTKARKEQKIKSKLWAETKKQT